MSLDLNFSSTNMSMFGTDMHLVTFIFIVIELIFFSHQLSFYLERPEEKKRKYYLIMLGLLIMYNVFSGLFPDPNLNISMNIQIPCAYGGGFVMASYFPYYFYKGLDIRGLGWDAKYGIFLFLILPFLIFFVYLFPQNGDLDLSVSWGLLIPFCYGIYFLVKTFVLIYRKYKGKNRLDAVLTYLAVIPWILLPVFSFIKSSQVVEALFMNGGFVIITFLFIRNTVDQNRKFYQKIRSVGGSEKEAVFKLKCEDLGLTPREIEIAGLVAKGLTNKTISEELFISERTVTKHLQNIFKKVEVKNRMELIKTIEVN